jgi:hypothetical protein
MELWTFLLLLHGKDEVSVPEEESMWKKDFTLKIFRLEGFHNMQSVTPFFFFFDKSKYI